MTQKLEWRVASRIGSLENAKHKADFHFSKFHTPIIHINLTLYLTNTISIVNLKEFL